MSTPELAVQVTDLHKDFVLPHQRQTSFKNVLMGRRNDAEPQHVLDGISLEIPRGEFFGIVGRNGSGKSTLLKILAGIYQPTSGTVTRNGSLVPLIELGVGFNPELTGRDNAYLSGALTGLSRREMDAAYDEIVAFAGLERFMDQKLKNYSSGMQVRLAFSLAVRANADILLIDEVLAVGDADFQRKCLAYFNDLKDSDTTVIFVSHSMDAVRQYCDRAVLLEEGQVRVAGTAEEVAQAYTRLFAAADYEEARQAGDRWGSGEATIESVTVAPSFTEADDQIVFSVDVAPAHDPIDVEVGFVVRERSGRQILGTASTGATQAKAYVVTLDASRHLTWRLPNVLGAGDYSITPTVVSHHSGEVLAQWDYAAHFSVYREPNTSLLIAAPISLEVD